jgi:hypothetical protein
VQSTNGTTAEKGNEGRCLGVLDLIESHSIHQRSNREIIYVNRGRNVLMTAQPSGDSSIESP